MTEETIATQSKGPLAATNEGERYVVECEFADVPAKSSVTPEMLRAYELRRAEMLRLREQATLDRNDRAFQELRNREELEEDAPTRLTRPQFFKD